MRGSLGALAVAVVVLVQAGAAAAPWDLVEAPASPAAVPAFDGAGRLVRVDPIHAAWSLDLGISVAAGKSVSTPAVKAKSVCALGDVDGDGKDDILVKVAPGKTDDKHKFEALAGPDFTRVLWTAEPKDKRLLLCGADVTGDAVPDPITVGEPVPAPPALAPSTPLATEATVTSTPLDGSGGAELAQIPVDASTRGTGGGPVQVGTDQTGAVVPAGQGTLLVVDIVDTAVAVSGPLPITVEPSQATVQVVDAAGAVLGSIATPPQADAVAAAPAPAADAGGLPGIVVLTETTAVPVEEVPVGLPAVTLYEGDGTQQWTAPQDATTGVPVVLPDAGDVDGDGTPDLIYATVPAELAPDVPVAPSGGFEVLSGADGSTLATSGPPQGGLVTALPFGDVTGDGADEILVIAQPGDGSGITLEVQDASGTAAWSVELPATAEPTNIEADPASGNTVGFSDVTGDGVPDVVVASQAQTYAIVEVIDGATGATAWEQQFDGADEVSAVPSADGAGEDLIVVDSDDGLAIEGVDGATGGTTWETSGPGPSSPAVTVAPAGDVDGDGANDVLVTLGSPDAAGAVDADQPASSYIVSGDSGFPIWRGSNVADGAGHVIELGNDASVAGEEGSGPWWMLAVALLVVLLLVLVVVKRRKKGEKAPPT